MRIIKLQGDIEKRNGIYYEYDVDAVPLGEGGMGRVFKGYRVVERTGERMPVAIKAIYDNIPERVVERARREAEIQIDSDNLIRMYGFVETVTHVDDERKRKVHYHVIMELLIGVTLENIMNGVTCDQNGMQIPFAAEIYSQYTQDRDVAVVRIMKAILSGLMSLHDKGYIHRDIDPSNIMLTIDGKIKLIDFGICKQIVSLASLDKSLTASGVFMGKVNYAAPELVLGDVKSQNYTTDIYALGVLLYQLCTGHLPFKGTDQEILSANLRKTLPMKDVHKAAFKKIIRKATEKSQSKRYASVAELRVDLERVPTESHEIGFGWIRIVVGVAAFVAIIVGCWFVFTPDNPQPQILVQQPTKQDLYDKALALLDKRDSVMKGVKILEVLAEDSFYKPAKVKLYAKWINDTSNVEHMKKAYDGLIQLAQESSPAREAVFECAITLSAANKCFSIPEIRQGLLGEKMDLERANNWFRMLIDSDSADYKSVYWEFNNLIDEKINKNSIKGDKRIVELYNLFQKRITNFDVENDKVAKTYKEAMDNDKRTLESWGLI